MAALFLLVLSSTGQFSATAQETDSLGWSPWHMTESEIKATGAVRLSETVRMMPGLETWSNDRYTLRILGTGMAGLHPGAPGLILDGVVLPAHFLDRSLTESLPVSPGDLTSLSWLPGQQVLKGGRMAEGRLHLRTPMISGWRVSGAMAVINETGDPGPAKHRDARRNNVDRSGPATWLRVSWGNARWMIQSGLQTDLHHLTDDRISGRVRRTYAEVAQPVITQFSPFFRLRHEGSRWQGHLLTGHSRRKDFIFHEAAGWEWPARLNRSWMVGMVEGSLQRVRLRLDTDASRVELANRPTFIELPEATTLQEASIEASLSTDLAGLAWTIGIGARSSDVQQADKSLSRLMPSARLGIGYAASSWNHSVGVHVLHIPSVDGRQATLSQMLRVQSAYHGTSGGLEMDLRFSEGQYPEAGQLAEWARAGLDMGQWMMLPLLNSDSGLPRSLGAGLIGYRKLASDWTGWIEGRVRLMDGQVMPDRTIDQRFGIGPLLPSWTWSSPHSGWLFSRTVGVNRVPERGIMMRAFLQLHHVSSEGDDVYFRHLTGFPRHRFWITASEERSGGFSWTTRIGYISAWTWPEYQEPARRHIPADIVVDATVGKSLLSGHLRALISLLNLPDRPLGNHPAGVEEQLAIRLTLTFSSVSVPFGE